MHSILVLFLFALFAIISARPSEPTIFNPDGTPKSSKRDVSLADLEGLTRNSRDRSGKAGDPPEKYFHESTFDAHYDGRFASTTLRRDERLMHLRSLVRSYLSTMQSIGAETWIMHGSLLGWWWNKRIMPWDSDIDVQVSEPALKYLASYYNMTVHTFKDAEAFGEEEGELIKEERKYLLEINPHYDNPSTDDYMNVIDARWIDTTTGLYIDITALRVNRTAPTHNGRRPSRSPPRTTSEPTRLYCKDMHQYLSNQIFPLRDTTFEGVPAKVPYAYQELLIEEYGGDSLVDTVFKKEYHFFDQGKQEWVPMTTKMVQKLMEEDRDAEAEILKEELSKMARQRGKKPSRKPKNEKDYKLTIDRNTDERT
ncbi:hypothetical protein K458DRAFT_393430 [Lentithecium fluviatile CBS 122367]|uniref:LicD/FKTN/FKRP nucleotidyltransferase domain-containing protein n=1 Tax=Lentithecium fluviatile CBS 122367 TaxID=1168545 RepID=A0A6G1INP5_9PLEO|nr:hypothetical protein K458DRAFT_393430 [Lentithecium fluviatile CBS 122367]